MVASRLYEIDVREVNSVFPRLSPGGIAVAMTGTLTTAMRFSHAPAMALPNDERPRRRGCRDPYVNDRQSHSAGPN